MMNWRKGWVFTVTFISYCLFHASRKTLSGVKVTITEDWLHTGNDTNVTDFFPTKAAASTFLGTLDAVFMAAYAVTMFYWGWLGDRLDPKNVISVGMIGSGLMLSIFGALPKWLHFYSIPYYVISYILFALFQACGWPNEVAIMANWFGKSNRGLILGLWASCQPVGNIMGSLMIAAVLKYGYEYAFLLNSCLIIIGGIVMFIGIDSRPHHHRTERSAVYESIHEDATEQETDSYEETEERPPAIGFFRAILLPSVLAYCLCNACLKLVNYAFFFWLPLYLNGKYSWSEAMADQLSIWYDIGGIVGSILGGIISDRIGCRSPVIVVFLTLSLGALFGYSQMPADIGWNAVVMSIVGVCISGPYNLIVGTISADLGSQPALSNSAEAMSTVSGLVDGTGSAGSAIGQIIIPLIDNNFGWDYVFYMFIVMNVLAVLCLLKRFIEDIQLILERYRTSREERETLISSHSIRQHSYGIHED